MKCINCNGTSIEVDDVRGEEVCVDCGYVLVENLLEESHNSFEYLKEGRNTPHDYVRGADFGMLGSRFEGQTIGQNTKLVAQLRRAQHRFSQRHERSVAEGYLECNMVLAPYLPNMALKERTQVYYKKLLLNHSFSLGDTIPIRATGLVFFVLKEFGMPITMAELSKSNNVNPDKASKMARKVARCLGKPYVLHRMSNSHWAEKIGIKLDASRDYVTEVRHVVDKISTLMDKHCIHFSKTYLAACFWMVSKMRCKAGKYPEFSQHALCQCIGCSDVGMRKSLTVILQTIGMSIEQMAILSVDEFLSGVRY